MSQATMAAELNQNQADGEVHALLAEANLLRTRKQPEQAINKCLEVLRRDPNNASAQSLLGDIHRDQGRPHEAVECYKLALQLNPAQLADREKLDTLLDELYARAPAGRAERTKPLAFGTEGGAMPLPMRKVSVWMLVAVIAALLVVLWGFAASRQHTRATAAAPASPTATHFATSQKTSAPATETLSASAPAHIASQPSVPAQQSDTTTATAALPERIDNLEKQIQAALQAEVATKRIPQSELLSAALDDRDHTATLAVQIHSSNLTPAELKQAMLKTAWVCLRAAVKQESQLTRLLIQGRGPLAGSAGSTHDTVLFTGEIAAEQVSAAQEGLTPPQLLALFTQASWHQPLDQAGL